MRTIRSVLSISTILGLAGCMSDVDRRASEGLSALESCDIRGAYQAFDDAYSMDRSRADIALAYALSDIATLAEDPAITALAPRLGFDRAINTELLWAEDGLLDRLTRDDDCDTIDAWFESTFPHPAVRPNGPDFWDTVDPTLTMGDIRTALVGVERRLTRIADALTTAAEHVDSQGVELSGGCGFTALPTRLQRPELYAAAAAIDAMVAVIQISKGYDGSLTFVHVFHGSEDDPEGWVADFNAHFLKPTDPDAIASARAHLERMVLRADEAVSAAMLLRPIPRAAESIFDWTAMPQEVLLDLRAITNAAMVALSEDGAAPLPFVTPSLGLDVGSFLSNPYDGTSAGPIWSVASDSWGTWVESSGALEDTLRSRFSPDPWADGAHFEWEWNIDDLEYAERESVFDPQRRWSGAYGCSSTTEPL